MRKTGDSDRREDRPKMFYYFIYNEKTGDFYPTYEEETPQDCIKIFPTKDDGSFGRWRVGIETAKERISNLEPYYMSIKQKWTVNERDYLSNDLKVKSTTAWNFKDVNSERGTEQFVDLNFDKNIFPRPKPIGTIRRLAEITTMDEDIILDFFSGSATTSQAIMQLNAEDGGNRKYILVQIPEVIDEKSEAYKKGYRTICDIGKERIRRAGEKIKAELIEKQKKADMLDENPVDPESLDIGFKVLKLDTSNIREWNVDFEDLENKLDLYDTPFIEDRTEMDIVYEIMLKQGLELTYPIETFEVNGRTIYNIAFGSLYICLSQKITPEIAKAIIASRDSQGTEVSSVIFSDAGFETDSDKLNCIEILKDAGYPEDNLLTL